MRPDLEHVIEFGKIEFSSETTRTSSRPAAYFFTVPLKNVGTDDITDPIRFELREGYIDKPGALLGSALLPGPIKAGESVTATGLCTRPRDKEPHPAFLQADWAERK